MFLSRNYGFQSPHLQDTYKGFTIAHDPVNTVLRRSYLPSTITRRERYTRCLSSPSLSLAIDILDNTPMKAVTFTNPIRSSLISPKSNSSVRSTARCSATRSSNDIKARTTNNVKTRIIDDIKTRASSYRRTSPPRRWWKSSSTLCTPDQLLEIIREPVGYYALPSDPYNEVYPGIYLSDAPTAMCTSLLKRLGVSHVLNAAQGKERDAGQVNTWPGFYSYSRIQFLGVEAFDNIVFRLYPYFDEAATFIDDALTSGGKVLVHCRAGISRSATLVCAFLMLKRSMSAQEAVRTVRKNRAIIPNDGFLQQLCDLNDRLSGHREL